VADTKPSTGSTAPRFSAGLITGVITLAWVVVFALVTVYGIGGVKQHDSAVATQAE